jgi:hypothetical protein
MKRSDLASASEAIRRVALALSKSERRHVLKVCDALDRAAELPTTRKVKPGDKLGAVVVVEITSGGEKGRFATVKCPRCGATWTMRLWRVRALAIAGRTSFCRTCRLRDYYGIGIGAHS